jgi:hypothetical protein
VAKVSRDRNAKPRSPVFIALSLTASLVALPLAPCPKITATDIAGAITSEPLLKSTCPLCGGKEVPCPKIALERIVLEKKSTSPSAGLAPAAGDVEWPVISASSPVGISFIRAILLQPPKHEPLFLIHRSLLI